MGALLALFSYPLQVHPAKTCIDNLFFGKIKDYGTGTTEDDIEIERRRRRVVAVVIMILTFIIAMIVDDLGIIFSIIGATASTTLCYILPGVFYLKMAYHRRQTCYVRFQTESGEDLTSVGNTDIEQDS